jgi:hypothetical protein
MWAREHGCPWVEDDEGESENVMNCCGCAALGRAPGGVELASGARLPVRRVDVFRPQSPDTWTSMPGGQLSAEA